MPKDTQPPTTGLGLHPGRAWGLTTTLTEFLRTKGSGGRRSSKRQRRSNKGKAAKA